MRPPTVSQTVGAGENEYGTAAQEASHACGGLNAGSEHGAPRCNPTPLRRGVERGRGGRGGWADTGVQEGWRDGLGDLGIVAP